MKLVTTMPAPVAGDETMYDIDLIDNRSGDVIGCVTRARRVDGRQGRQVSYLSEDGQWITKRIKVGQSFRFYRWEKSDEK
jgi:hypothetical protein